jgi:5-methylcytosine-specific restriction endonuclease McrA
MRLPTNKFAYAEYMNSRYWRRKTVAVEHLGGRCAHCESTDGLEFDHVDPSSKEFTVTNRLDSAPWEVILGELAKCQLLCQPCHAAKSIRDRGYQSTKGVHGTLSSYRYCKCVECKAAKSSYMREYYKRRK